MINMKFRLSLFVTRSIVLGFLFIGGLSSCHFSGVRDVSIYTNIIEKPDSSLFWGEWELDSMNFIDIKESYSTGGDPIRMIFNQDGTFDAFLFPDAVADVWGDSHGKQKNATGKWKLGKNNKSWGLDMYFDAGDLYKNGVVTGFFVYRDRTRQNELVIRVIIGDGDSGNFLLFRPKKSPGDTSGVVRTSIL